MKFKKLVITTVIFSLFSFLSHAGNEKAKYSTEEYCLLNKAGIIEGHLKAYAKKLGQTPSKKVCRSFNEFVKNATPKDWDYRGGRPYPGSALRLSASQIEKLKAAK